MEKKIQLGENAAQKKAQNKDMLGGRFFKPDSEQCMIGTVWMSLEIFRKTIRLMNIWCNQVSCGIW